MTFFKSLNFLFIFSFIFLHLADVQIKYISSFSLDDITSSSLGYILSGTEKDEHFGNMLSRTKGDFNHDGYYDLLIHSWMPNSSIKKVSLFLGSPIGLYKGLTIFYKEYYDHEGQIAADFIGDVNGDGMDDFMICSAKADSELGPGKCYLIFGTKKIPGTIDLTINDVDILASRGIIFSDNLKVDSKSDRVTFGNSFAGLLDIDNDGIPEFAISNMAAKINSKVIDCKNGIYYVIRNISFFKSGQVNILSKFNMSSKNFGFTIEDTKHDSGCFGTSALGDVNGDGFNDIIISADGENKENGVAYVIFGKSSFPNTFSVDDLNMDEFHLPKGFKISRNQESRGAIGYDILGNIDINGDNRKDIVLGERFWGRNKVTRYTIPSGRVSIIFGSDKEFPTFLDLDSLNKEKVEIDNYWPVSGFGWILANAGDLNADGFDDLLIGCQYDSIFVIYGQKSFTEDLSTNYLDGKNGFRIKHNSNKYSSELTKTVVSGFGDSNMDGIHDFAIGYPEVLSNDQSNAGIVVIITSGAISQQASVPKNMISKCKLEYNPITHTICDLDTKNCTNNQFNVYPITYFDNFTKIRSENSTITNVTCQSYFNHSNDICDMIKIKYNFLCSYDNTSCLLENFKLIQSFHNKSLNEAVDDNFSKISEKNEHYCISSESENSNFLIIFALFFFICLSIVLFIILYQKNKNSNKNSHKIENFRQNRQNKEIELSNLKEKFVI